MLPNALTIVRLLLVPGILWLTYSTEPEKLGAALALFALAVLTDWLDGHLARSHGLVTPFGTVMDPVVDKILMLGVLFVLSARPHEVLPLWVPLVILSREFLVSAVRQFGAAHGGLVGANWMGKTKFVIQSAVIIMAYAHLILKGSGRPIPFGGLVVMIAAVLMTVVSALFGLNFARMHLGGGKKARA